jgi:hypothetical protein
VSKPLWRIAYFVDTFFFSAAFKGAFLAALFAPGFFVDLTVFETVFADTDFLAAEGFRAVVDFLPVGLEVATFLGVFARVVEMCAFNSALRSATLIVVADLRSRSSP